MLDLRALVFAAAASTLCLTAAANAAEPQPTGVRTATAAPVEAGGTAPAATDAKVCMKESLTGTRMPKRICRTKA